MSRTDVEAVARWAENQHFQAYHRQVAFAHAGEAKVGLWWKVGKGGVERLRGWNDAADEVADEDVRKRSGGGEQSWRSTYT